MPLQKTQREFSKHGHDAWVFACATRSQCAVVGGARFRAPATKLTPPGPARRGVSGTYYMKLLLKGDKFLWFAQSLYQIPQRYRYGRRMLFWEPVGTAKYAYLFLTEPLGRRFDRTRIRHDQGTKAATSILVKALTRPFLQEN
jgi:hypothetical protein